MNPLTLWQLFFEQQFQVGFAAGIGAVALGLSLRRHRPDWGVLWGAATLGAALVMDVLNSRVLERVVETPFSAVVAAAFSLGVAAVGIHAARERRELPLVIGLTIGGVWSTVPDTETIGILMGVTAALLWVWWPEPRIQIAALGAVIVPALIVTTALVGGASGPDALASAIGVVASLYVFSIGRPTTAVIDVGIHALIVLGWSRWAGFAGSAGAAFAIGTVVVALGVAARLIVPVILDRSRVNASHNGQT